MAGFLWTDLASGDKRMVISTEHCSLFPQPRVAVAGSLRATPAPCQLDRQGPVCEQWWVATIEVSANAGKEAGTRFVMNREGQSCTRDSQANECVQPKVYRAGLSEYRPFYKP